MKNVTVKSFGAHAILIEWKPSIDDKTFSEILQVKQFVTQSFSEEILEVVPAYSSLAIYMKLETNLDTFISKLKHSLENILKTEQAASRIIYIPVCYDLEFAPDIQEVAQKNSLSISEVITIHTTPTYKVYFLGFLPGFPYLGGLDKRLHTSRKETPRQKVESGSVAIGGSQTGIYTTDSPGGWQIIGKTPLSLFSIKNNPPALLKAGDFIKFKSISKDEFRKIEIEITADVYKIEEEVAHD